MAFDPGLSYPQIAPPATRQTHLCLCCGPVAHDAAPERGHWTGESKVAVAGHVRTLMLAARQWKEKSEKKNPDKDNDYQDTLKILAWLKDQ